MSRSGITDDLALSKGEAAHVRRVGIVAVGEEVATTIGVEVVDQRPPTGEECLPEVKRCVRVLFPKASAGPIEGDRTLAESCEVDPIVRTTEGCG
jgi:hypothetical protein